jgi:D-cysteine desulfhydrase
MRSPRRLHLAQLPTPLIKLHRLCAELDGADLWLKRDDLTGLEISGNKVRKLEYVVADAVDHGCDTLITEGTCQSNHCRATAAVCARLGLRSMLLLRPEPPGPPQGNHLLDTLFDAQTRSFARPDFSARRDAIVAEVEQELLAAGHRGRWTPAGASEPLGCWGYIRAAAELAEQLIQLDSAPCDVVVPLSSGGTYAGLILGRLLHRLDHLTIWGVPVSDDIPYHIDALTKLCEAAIQEYELPITFSEDILQLVDGWIGEGYAIPYPADIDAIRLLARTEGILLDPVYTGKAFAALLAGIADGRWGRERPVVFIHTGGIFSNFAWPDTLVPPNA